MKTILNEQIEQWKNLLCVDDYSRNRYKELLRECHNEPMWTLMELRSELIDSKKRGNIPLEDFIMAYNMGGFTFLEICQEYFLEPLFPMSTGVSQSLEKKIIRIRIEILDRVKELIKENSKEKILSELYNGRTVSLHKESLHKRIFRVLNGMG